MTGYDDYDDNYDDDDDGDSDGYNSHDDDMIEMTMEMME